MPNDNNARPGEQGPALALPTRQPRRRNLQLQEKSPSRRRSNRGQDLSGEEVEAEEEMIIMLWI